MKWLFSKALAKNAEESEVKSIFKAFLNESADLSRDFLKENNNMYSAYKKIWKSDESTDKQICDV